MALEAERFLQLMVSPRVTGWGRSPETRQDLSCLCLPAQPGQSASSVTSCPSADQAQRASLLPQPFGKVGQLCTLQAQLLAKRCLFELEKGSISQISVSTSQETALPTPSWVAQITFFSAPLPPWKLSSASPTSGPLPHPNPLEWYLPSSPSSQLALVFSPPHTSRVPSPCLCDPVPVALASAVPETAPVAC